MAVLHLPGFVPDAVPELVSKQARYEILFAVKTEPLLAPQIIRTIGTCIGHALASRQHAVYRESSQVCMCMFGELVRPRRV